MSPTEEEITIDKMEALPALKYNLDKIPSDQRASAYADAIAEKEYSLDAVEGGLFMSVPAS